MKILAVLLVIAPLGAATKEEKLVDALLKAQRKVEHANAASESAGAALAGYCRSINKEVRVKPNGTIGCIVPTPQPKRTGAEKPKEPEK